MNSCLRLAAAAFILYFFSSLALLSYPYDSSESNSDPKQDFSQYFSQGEQARAQGKYEESIELFKEALASARKNQDHPAEMEALVKIGLLYWNTGELPDSQNFYQQALSAAEKAALTEKKEEIEKYIQIHNLYQDGKEYFSEGNLRESIESFERAIALAKEIQSPEHEVKCLRLLSIRYLELDDFERYKSLNESALEIARRLNHEKEQGRCLFNIGYYYGAVEDYSQALQHYEEALRKARIVEDYGDESDCLTNISNIYRRLGDFDKALEYLRQVLRIDRELLPDEAYVAIDLNSIGVTYQKKALQTGKDEDLDRALENYEESLRIARRIKDDETEIEALNNIGMAYVDLKRYPEALEYFKQAMAKAEENQDKEETANILVNIGIVYSKQEKYDLAVESLQRALDAASQIGKENTLWEAHFEIANTYMRRGDYQKSLENYESSVEHLEKIRSRIQLEELKASYLGTDKRIETYQNVVDLLYKLSRLEPEKLYCQEAFHFLERAKARAFLDRLEVSKVNIARGVDRELLIQEEELMNEISALNSELFKPGLNDPEKQDIREKLRQSEDRLEALKRTIRISSPAYANLKYPQIISLEQAQRQLLDSKTAFLEYSLGETSSYAFTITRSGSKMFPLPPARTIRSQVREYLQAIAVKENKDFSLGHELYKILVLPGLDRKITKLVIIPDDILHYLPFETLLSREEDNSWLVKDYKIAYAPSISSLREIIQQEVAREHKRQKDILAFGDPYFGPEEEGTEAEDTAKTASAADSSQFPRLKFSGQEIEKIAALFKKENTSLFKRREATEERLKALDLDDYKILHFATHCIIDDTKPDRSSIVFSVGSVSSEDEILQMREVFNLKLNSDLVTLSACQTGLGQLIRGEGVVGLSRAFFYAGASSALISLWAVHDQATSQFMERYYFHLRASHSVMDALQKTKLEMIDSGVLSHPYYWAAFIVTGNTDKVIYPATVKNVIFLVAVIVLALGIISFFVFKKIF